MSQSLQVSVSQENRYVCLFSCSKSATEQIPNDTLLIWRQSHIVVNRSSSSPALLCCLLEHEGGCGRFGGPLLQSGWRRRPPTENLITQRWRGFLSLRLSCFFSQCFDPKSFGDSQTALIPPHPCPWRVITRSFIFSCMAPYRDTHLWHQCSSN